MSTNNNKYSTLEEAINAMIEDKMGCPWSVVFLDPMEDELYSRWNANNNFVSTNYFYSNSPGINIQNTGTQDDIAQSIQKLENDRNAYVAEKAALIKQTFGVKGDEGWQLSFVDTNDGTSGEEVALAILPQFADTIDEKINSFNKECRDSGFSTNLHLNRNSMIIEGEFFEKKGNFFTKGKVKSENKRAHKAFRDFLNSLDPYLWKLTKH